MSPSDAILMAHKRYGDGLTLQQREEYLTVFRHMVDKCFRGMSMEEIVEAKLKGGCDGRFNETERE